jgi:hypothetical protein
MTINSIPSNIPKRKKIDVHAKTGTWILKSTSLRIAEKLKCLPMDKGTNVRWLTHITGK